MQLAELDANTDQQKPYWMDHNLNGSLSDDKSDDRGVGRKARGPQWSGSDPYAIGDELPEIRDQIEPIYEQINSSDSATPLNLDYFQADEIPSMRVNEELGYTPP